ncbi:MAG: 4Fe-4S binding protein [Rikenellaceae bacterium]
MYFTFAVTQLTTYKKNNKMAYKIDQDTCLGCGSCVDECPVGAISAGAAYVIDAAACSDCGSCAGACPVEAISAE